MQRLGDGDELLSPNSQLRNGRGRVDAAAQAAQPFGGDFSHLTTGYEASTGGFSPE